jgi:hypothetical protein
MFTCNLFLVFAFKKLPDVIDFFIVKNISTNYIKIEEGFDLNSDHSPIYPTI